jgi:hypothetical protein
VQALEEHEQERLDPLILVEPPVPGVPVEFLLAHPEGDRADERGKGRRPGHGRRQPHGARIDVEIGRGNGEQSVPALDEGRRNLGGFALFGQGRPQGLEEVVVRGLAGQGREGEAPSVVVERGVDDEIRTVSARLALAEVRERDGAQETLLEDLEE